MKKMKLNKIFIPKITLYTIIALSMLSGWYLHVFKLWTFELYHKALACDEVRCTQIMDLAVELEDYNLPVDNLKNTKGVKKNGK